MMREASAPVEAYSAIKSWRASRVVGTSNTNGMDALYGIGKTKTENIVCEYDPSSIRRNVETMETRGSRVKDYCTQNGETVSPSSVQSQGYYVATA